MAISEEQRRKNMALKERLLRERAQRRMREELGIEKKRPLSNIAAAEKGAPSSESKQLGKGKDALKKTGQVLGKGLKYAGTGIAAGAGFLAGRATAGGSTSKYSGEPKEGLGWLMLLLSIGLYLSDLFVTRFNGIDVKWFSDLSSLDLIMKGGVLTVFAIVVIFELFLGGTKSRDEKIWAAVYAAILAFVFVSTSGSAGSLLHLAFASVLWFALIKGSDSIENGYKTISVLVLLDFFLFSSLEY